MKNNQWMLSVITSLLVVCTASAKEPAKVEFPSSANARAAAAFFGGGSRDNTLIYPGKSGTRPGTRELVPGGMKEEAKQVMSNIKTTLEAHGYSLRDLVKCTVMLADMSKWGDFNEIHKSFFRRPVSGTQRDGRQRPRARAQVEAEWHRGGERR
jgi:enamine deaminase RidA (YjgF/YER057c/UK114 family)